MRFVPRPRVMPVSIYRIAPDDHDNAQVVWLCDKEWSLWPQIEALSEWLEKSAVNLPLGEYVANVGFCWRRDASAGGPVLDVTMMRRMSDLRMSLFLSEYPGFVGERAPA